MLVYDLCLCDNGFKTGITVYRSSINIKGKNNG